MRIDKTRGKPEQEQEGKLEGEDSGKRRWLGGER